MKDDRGDNDLEVIIDRLTKQKEFLQFQCRKAGDTISGYKMLIDEGLLELPKKEAVEAKITKVEKFMKYSESCGMIKP